MMSESRINAPDWAKEAFAQRGPKSAGSPRPDGAFDITTFVARTTRRCFWNASLNVDSAYSVTPAKTDATMISTMTIFVPRCIAFVRMPAPGHRLSGAKVEKLRSWSATGSSYPYLRPTPAPLGAHREGFPDAYPFSRTRDSINRAHGRARAARGGARGLHRQTHRVRGRARRDDGNPHGVRRGH